MPAGEAIEADLTMDRTVSNTLPHTILTGSITIVIFEYFTETGTVLVFGEIGYIIYGLFSFQQECFGFAELQFFDEIIGV